MSRATPELVYPESRFGGFTRFDGTIAFFTRVQALLPESGVVLDIGCGRGRRSDDVCRYRRELQDLRGSGRNVIGIDVDPAAAENRFVDEFRLIADTSRWPVDDTSIDLAVSDYVMEHVDRPESFFAEARRVLKHGGFLCVRTPNARGYVGLLARMIPNRYHGSLAEFSQADRRACDVFPTLYRCNTRRRMSRMLDRFGFEGCVLMIEAEPSYLTFSRLAYRLGAVAHRLTPPGLRSTILLFARKV